VTTWEISFAQSKDAQQSSLEQSQEKAGICTRSHAEFDSQRFLRTTAVRHQTTCVYGYDAKSLQIHSVSVKTHTLRVLAQAARLSPTTVIAGHECDVVVKLRPGFPLSSAFRPFRFCAGVFHGAPRPSFSLLTEINSLCHRDSSCGWSFRVLRSEKCAGCLTDGQSRYQVKRGRQEMNNEKCFLGAQECGC
jgi:hypothetical protein